jgi:hypothetical protein
MHEWRKRVKDLRYAAEILERRDPENRLGADGHARGAGPGGHLQAEPIHTVATRADELGELLGEEHDLAVLAERVRASGGPFEDEESAREALLKLIARRRRRLRRRALREGERLYRRRPKRFVARMRDAYARASGGRARSRASAAQK